MKFNSQICTTKEQSERLLALGLKKETADCVVSSIGSKDRLIHTEEPIYVMESLTSKRIPNYLAWSLHRLIEMMPQWIHTIDGSFKLTIDQGKLVCYREISDEVQTFVFGHTSLYDSIIDIIEKLIKESHFNKEYLEE